MITVSVRGFPIILDRIMLKTKLALETASMGDHDRCHPGETAAKCHVNEAHTIPSTSVPDMLSRPLSSPCFCLASSEVSQRGKCKAVQQCLARSGGAAMFPVPPWGVSEWRIN